MSCDVQSVVPSEVDPKAEVEEFLQKFAVREMSESKILDPHLHQTFGTCRTKLSRDKLMDVELSTYLAIPSQYFYE